MRDAFSITKIARLAAILITVVSRFLWQPLTLFHCAHQVQPIIPSSSDLHHSPQVNGRQNP